MNVCWEQITVMWMLYAPTFRMDLTVPATLDLREMALLALVSFSFLSPFRNPFPSPSPFLFLFSLYFFELFWNTLTKRSKERKRWREGEPKSGKKNKTNANKRTKKSQQIWTNVMERTEETTVMGMPPVSTFQEAFNAAVSLDSLAMDSLALVFFFLFSFFLSLLLLFYLLYPLSHFSTMTFSSPWERNNKNNNQIGIIMIMIMIMTTIK